MSKIFTAVHKQAMQEEKERNMKMTCPKCKAKMMEYGAITVKRDGKEIRHCAKCYGEWLQENIPIYEMPSVSEGA